MGHRVISYDRRGFGRSPGPPASRKADHVAAAAALLEELDAEPAAALGWSAGGVVALGLAVERPDLVSALILVESDPPPAPPAYHEQRDGRMIRWIDTPG